MLALALAAALALSEPTSTPVALQGQPAPLHGTLLTPDGPTLAAAVIVPGSGPTDRNGDNPLGVSAASYRLLAEALAERGIATVRIDKRGVGESAAAILAEEELTFSTYIEDVRGWADETARLTGRPCVWLIGHSEGSQVALGAVSGGNPTVCGLVLLAGEGRPIAVVLREQFEAGLPDVLKAPALATLAELEAGRRVADPPAALNSIFRFSVQPYIISWLALDPAEEIALWTGPVMIGQGTHDLQVTTTDARALATAQPAARLILWEGVNHVLKTAPVERAGNLATYSNPTLPLAPGIAEDVASFILEPH